MKKTLLWVLRLESVLVASLAGYMIILGFTHDKEWAPYLGVISFSFSGALGLYVLSIGISQRKRWANAPTILANLIALGVAKYQFEAGLYWLGIPIAFLAITALITDLAVLRKETL